jgi:signal peptidase
MHRWGFAILLAIAGLLTLSAVAPAAAPIAVTTPATGSMHPTAPTDSLVLVVDTEPQVGEIALFESNEYDRPVLHRLVARTEDGTAFVTQGDANDRTDQETGSPAVTPDQIYGTVPTIAGHPIVIPLLGRLVTNPVLFAGVWGVLGLSLLYSTTGGETVRETVASVPLRVHVVVLGVVIAVALPTAVLWAPAIADAHILTTTTAPADDPSLVRPGETGRRTVVVSSPVMWSLHQTVHVSGDLHLEATEANPGSDAMVVTVANEPAKEPTVHRGTITVYSYPAVLPAGAIAALAAIHPAVAAFATAIVLGGAVVLLGFVLIDPGRTVRASRKTIRRGRHRVRNRLDRTPKYR